MAGAGCSNVGTAAAEGEVLDGEIHEDRDRERQPSPFSLLHFNEGPHSARLPEDELTWASTKPPYLRRVEGSVAAGSVTQRHRRPPWERSSTASPSSKSWHQHPHARASPTYSESTRAPSRAATATPEHARIGTPALPGGRQTPGRWLQTPDPFAMPPSQEEPLCPHPPRPPSNMERSSTPRTARRRSRAVSASPGSGTTRELVSMLKGAVQGMNSFSTTDCLEDTVERVPSGTSGTGSATDGGGDFTVSQDLSVTLAAAAELCGSRARGEISTAMRSRVQGRWQESSALRSSLYLNSSSLTTGGMVEDSNTGSSTGSRATASALTPLLSTAELWFREFGDDRDPRPQYVYKRKQVVEVPQNTTLGKMVARNPQRAKKYNLVAVPAKNKPWPPPPLSRRDGPDDDLEDDEDDDAAAGYNSAGRLRDATWKKMKAVAKVVTLRASKHDPHRSLVQSLKAQDGDAGRATPRWYSESDNVDLDAVEHRITKDEKKTLKEVYDRFCYGESDRGLSAKGLQLALKAVGIKDPTSLRDQQRLREVQEAVVERFRSDLFHEETFPHPVHPINDPNVRWKLEEFRLMVAGILEVEKKIAKEVEEQEIHRKSVAAQEKLDVLAELNTPAGARARKHRRSIHLSSRKSRSHLVPSGAPERTKAEGAQLPTAILAAAAGGFAADGGLVGVSPSPTA